MKRRLAGLLTLAFVAALLGGIGAFAPAVAQEAADIDTSHIKEMTLGNPDSPVTVIEYASFTCPHCAAFHSDGFKKLKSEYIDPGKINFIYREVYFDRLGLWATIVARCGENAENRYFGIADILYEQQSDWARQENPKDIVASLRRIGKTAGLNDEQLDQCLTDADNAQTLYAQWLQRSEADGITSTPSFLIDGVKYQNMPYDEMKEIIDAALGS